MSNTELRELIKHNAPSSVLKLYRYVKSNMVDGYARKSYSQEGEDLILSRIFENRKCGFYVDVGAHHPYRYSNTAHFYKRGWRGINIDAMPGCMDVFRRKRPRDTNLEIAVSDKKECLTYYMFDESALNGFSVDLVNERVNNTSYRLIGTRELQTLTLTEILDEHLSGNQQITFLNVDVEGHDLKILRSNDWNKYQPEVVLIEILSCPIDCLATNTVYQFLTEKHYKLYAKTVSTAIFIRRNLG